MKKNKKKLPKFVGGKQPTSLGYLRPLGVGKASYSTVPGISLEPEVKAAKNNLLPYAISKFLQNMAMPMQVALGISTVPTGVVNFGTLAALTDTLNQATAGLKAGTPNVVGDISNLGTKSVLNTASKVAGVVGTVYGAGNVVNDFVNAGTHRDVQDMRDTLSTNVVTTPGGNQYTTKTGFNAGAERRYEDVNRLQKQIGLTADLAGMGASAGGLVGGVPGLILGGIGGLLLGGIGSLFGFGDNSDEIEEAIGNMQNSLAMENRLNKSVADSQDVTDAFYNRAANGKQPVYSPLGAVNRKATARVSNGELIGNFEDGYVSRVPGKKNNKDTKLAALKNSDFVISNKYGLSDYAAATGDYAGALNMLELMLRKYKNGKTPRYWLGKAGDYITSIAPHIASLASNIDLYNRAKYADTYVPELYVNNPEGTRAVNELANLRFDVDPYYREATRGLNQANWNVRRNVGLGTGGRAIALNANYASYLGGLRDITKMYNDAQNAYREKYANALASLGATNQGRRMEAVAKRHALLQQAQGAKENWMAQYRKNIDQALLNAAAEYMRMGQYNDSLGIQKKILELYEQGVKNDKIKTLAYIDGLGNNRLIPTPIEHNTPVNEFYSWLEGLTPAERQAMYGKWARRGLVLGIV